MFQITEQAVTVPNPKNLNKAIEALQKDNLHARAVLPNDNLHVRAVSPNNNLHVRAVSPNDSGVFEFSRPQTANSESANQKRVNSAKQITFERTLPRYLNGTSYHLNQHPNTPALYTRQPANGCHGNEASPVLFRRSHRVPLESQPFLKRLLMQEQAQQKKPVYLHTSQIQLYDD